MSKNKTIALKIIMTSGLIVSVAALPFSLKVCHAGMIIMLAAWLLEGRWREKLYLINRSILLQVILALFLVLAVGLIYSDSLLEGWLRAEKKIFFLLIPIALATTFIKLTAREISLIFYSFLIACFTGTILCILHSWNQADMVMAGEGSINYYLGTSDYKDLHPLDSEKWLIFSYASLSEGINIHPTYFSLYLGFCIVFLLHQLHRVRSAGIKTALGLLALYFAVFVIFLATRIIIMGLSIIFIFVFIRSLLDKQKSLALIIIVMATVFSFLLFINPVSRYRNLQEIGFSTFKIQPDNVYRKAAQTRISLWYLAIKSIQPANILWGNGTGDVKMVMEQTSNHYNITNVLGSFDPHNQYLYTLLGNGILGCLLLIVCLGLPGYFAWLRKDYLFLGFSFLFSLLCFTESAMELQKGIGFYTLFLSLFSFQSHSFQNISINSRPLIRAGN